ALTCRSCGGPCPSKTMFCTQCGARVADFQDLRNADRNGGARKWLLAGGIIAFGLCSLVIVIAYLSQGTAAYEAPHSASELTAAASGSLTDAIAIPRWKIRTGISNGELRTEVADLGCQGVDKYSEPGYGVGYSHLDFDDCLDGKDACYLQQKFVCEGS